MNRLRVLACAFACHPPGKVGFSGGEDILGWSLVKQVARFHDVWALTDARNRTSIEEILEEESIPSLHFIYIGLPSWLHTFLRFQGSHQLYAYLWQIKAYFVARRLNNSLTFDLFHHITYANDWMASFIGALLPIPYIRGPGGGAQRTPKGFEQEYSMAGRLWENFRHVGQWLLRHDPVFVKGQNQARYLLLCNKESVSNLPDKWARKVHFFPVSGISTEDMAVVSPSKADDKFNILMAGSLIQVKGFSLAIKAFKQFDDRCPGTTLSLIGSGPEEPRLRSLVNRLDLQSKIQFTQSLPRNELLARMAAADIFLFPSLRDGGGGVIVEAMSLGKPVVCLNTGGPGMHVSDECGVKIAPVTSEDAIRKLSAALERLYRDEETRLKLGKAAREKVKVAYHWDTLGERLMEFYRDSLAS